MLPKKQRNSRQKPINQDVTFNPAPLLMERNLVVPQKRIIHLRKNKKNIQVRFVWCNTEKCKILEKSHGRWTALYYHKALFTAMTFPGCLSSFRVVPASGDDT